MVWRMLWEISIESISIRTMKFFIVSGAGVFGFEGNDGRKFTITVEAGDYIVIPAHAWHWFYMIEGRGITAPADFQG